MEIFIYLEKWKGSIMFGRGIRRSDSNITLRINKKYQRDL